MLVLALCLVIIIKHICKTQCRRMPQMRYDQDRRWLGFRINPHTTKRTVKLTNVLMR